MMTGRMPSEIGMRRNEDIMNDVPENISATTIGTLLENAGYETFYGGKIHLPRNISPKEKGFNYFCSDERDILARESVNFIMTSHSKPFYLTTSFINPHDICYMALKDYPKGMSAQRLANKAKPEIETLEKAMKIPKGIDSERFYNEFCPALPLNYQPQENAPTIFELFRNRRPFKEHAFKFWNDDTWKLHRWAYCRLTELVDSQIALLLDALKKSGQIDNTLIIFSSDHGDMDGAHRLEHKSYFYEEAAKIPFIMTYPGHIKEGVVSDALVSNGLDLMPTLCDYAEIPTPEYCRGFSLRAIAEGKNADRREYVFAESELGNMVRTKDYKYVIYDSGNNNEQLYNMRSDPYEKRNAANDKEKQEILSKHRNIMKKELKFQAKNIPEKYQDKYYSLNSL
jgi:choline-sulfatase